MLKMYDELATWWHLLSPVTDYEEEATFFAQILTEAGLPPAPSLFELGSGGGNNAFYLKKIFGHVMLSDLSAHMLAVSQTINPDCTHVTGDMRSLRLGRTFDVVFVHDAIDYMTTPAELKQAMETAFAHCKKGGVALFVPDHLEETFEPSTDHGGNDGDDRALRYMDWTYDPDKNDMLCKTEYVYVLHETDQPTRVEYEEHVFGLFSRALWLDLMHEVGFEPTIVKDPEGRELFLGRK